MKVISIFIGLITVFITLPVQIFSSWLLYQHVQATDLMWFLWWFQAPFLIVISILGVLVKELASKS